MASNKEVFELGKLAFSHFLNGNSSSIALTNSILEAQKTDKDLLRVYGYTSLAIFELGALLNKTMAKIPLAGSGSAAILAYSDYEHISAQLKGEEPFNPEQLANFAGNLAQILSGLIGAAALVTAGVAASPVLVGVGLLAGAGRRESDNHDLISFGGGYDRNNLWFSRQGLHLMIDALESDDQIQVSNWYRGRRYRIEAIEAAGSTITEQGINALVQAMASFAVPDAIEEHPRQHNESLRIAIDNHWQSESPSVVT